MHSYFMNFFLNNNQEIGLRQKKIKVLKFQNLRPGLNLKIINFRMNLNINSEYLYIFKADFYLNASYLQNLREN